MKNSIITEERKKLGLSQEELANKLNISQKSVSKYELFARRPSYETLLDMATLFNVPIEDLLLNFLSEGDYLKYKENVHQLSEIAYPTKNKNQLDTSESPHDQHLSPNERTLLQAFDRCSEECKQYLIAKAHVLSVEGISAVAAGEYGKYIDEEKKSHPLNGTEDTGI